MTKRSLIYSSGARRVYLVPTRQQHRATQYHLETEDNGVLVYCGKPGSGTAALAELPQQQQPAAHDVSRAASTLARAKQRRVDTGATLFEVGR